jgi:hypothetical protein
MFESHTSSGTTRANAPRNPSHGSRAATSESTVAARSTEPEVPDVETGVGAGSFAIWVWRALSWCCLLLTDELDDQTMVTSPPTVASIRAPAPARSTGFDWAEPNRAAAVELRSRGRRLTALI